MCWISGPYHSPTPVVRRAWEACGGHLVHSAEINPRHPGQNGGVSTSPRFVELDHNLDDQELERRWREFHRTVRTASSGPVARALAPLLGDDTRRRQLLNRVRPTPLTPVSREILPSESFPGGFVHQPLRGEPLAPEDVVIVPLAPGDSPAKVVEALERALELPSTWVLVVDDSRGWPEHHAVARRLLESATDGDVVFADEQGENIHRPRLKPDAIGPHTLWSYNVVGRPALLRASLVRGVGGVRLEAGAALEHDLYLRLLEVGARFIHVPEVLPGRPLHVDPLLSVDTQRVVRAALTRRSLAAEVSAGTLDSVVAWRLTPQDSPRVDIVIPTRDRLDLLRRCLDSLTSLTRYPHYRVIICDNDSIEPATREFFATTSHDVVACPGPFNYAAIVNAGARHGEGDFILTLNNDTVITQPDWLEQLVALAQLDDVAIVGCALVEENGTHDHDGIAIAPYPQHVRRGVNYPVVDEFISSRRDVAAVTGAVQIFSRTTFDELGGLDESLPVVMNDVDFCLRAQRDGRYVVFLNDVEVTHAPSSSRGRLDPLEDRNRFVRRWGVFRELRDPFFPPTMSVAGHSVVWVPSGTLET